MFWRKKNKFSPCCAYIARGRTKPPFFLSNSGQGPNNIRHTHFSRNPKIAAFLKAYHFVKEFGEGFDRICREQEANGANVPSFRTDEFILKITVPKVTEKVNVKTEKVSEKVTVNVTEKMKGTEQKRAERLTENRHGLIEKHQKLIEKADRQGDKLTENRISILRFVMDDPYISKADLSKLVGISVAAISANIEVLRGKYLRRVGPDKGGFWEIIS